MIKEKENEEFIAVRLDNSFCHTNHKKKIYELPKTPETSFIVDDSSFVPLSEALKQLDNVAPLSSEQEAKFYDFADGSDNGMSIPINRSPRDYSDIAEISTAIVDKVKEASENLSNITTSIAENQEFKNSLESVRGSSDKKE